MIHLDTHVVVWLAAGETARISEHGLRRLRLEAAMVSPAVRLELQLLHEIGRLTRAAAEVLDVLEEQVDLRVSPTGFDRVVRYAAPLRWTRDPFDRLIAANALADDLPLLTRDRRILEHLPVAVWDDDAPA